MSFELHHRKHIEDQLTKIVRKELRDAAHALTTSSLGSQFRSDVHESRRTIKKVRAVASLLTQAGAKLPRTDRKRVKTAARALSHIRDGTAVIDTFDRVRGRYPNQLPERTYDALRRGLVAARDRSEARAQQDGVVAEAAERLRKTSESARRWTCPSIKWPDLVAYITLSYRRSRHAMTRARDTEQSATLHRWRKDVKTLWYQLRLATLLTTGTAPLLAELNRLETELGDDHDLEVLAAALRSCRDLRPVGEDIRQFDRLAARMRQPLRRHALARGRRLYARRPAAFARWLHASFTQARPRQTPVPATAPTRSVRRRPRRCVQEVPHRAR
jgi:CHAD domain-containing protein